MVKYKVSSGPSIIEFQTEQAAIDYAAEFGGDVAEVIETIVVDNHLPDVTPRQIRQALVASGVSLADIETALNSLPEPTKSYAKIEWEYSVSFQRNRPLVNSVGQMLGWTSEQVDNLWRLAGSLK